MFYKILVVDDDESVVEILATGLEKENLQIYKACDGETAFEIISDKKPHVVISDLVMPGLGGWQLFEQTRKTSPDTIFIFLTGYGSIPDATSSIKKGVFDYLEKPFSIQKIRNVLNSALEHYDTIQENNYLKQRLSSLKNRYIDLDMLLKHSSRIREVTDFASYLKEDTSEKDLLKKLLKAALEITRSKNGSIYLHDSKESKFSLELIESLAVAPDLAVKNVQVDQTSLLSQHKSVSCNFSSSTETAAMPSPRQQDFTNSQETMTISIESGHRDWGVLYLLGKISDENYHLEDFVNVSLLARKAAERLTQIEFLDQDAVFNENSETLRKVHENLQFQSVHLAKSLAILTLVIDDSCRILDASKKYKDIVCRDDNMTSGYLFDEPLWTSMKEDTRNNFLKAMKKNQIFVSDQIIPVETPYSRYFFKFRMIPVFSKKARPQSTIFLIVLDDITMQENIEKRLLALENISLMGKLVACISHDLNNPLDGLNRLVKIIENKVCDKVEYEYFEMIYSTIKRMADTIRAFSESTSKAVVKTKFAPLCEILDEAIHIMSPKLSDKNIEVKRGGRSQHVEINVSTDLYNAFVNLIGNAFDAMDANGVIEIEILLNPDQRHVDIVFKDDGVGIPEAIIGDVMKPFFTTKEDGTGLGLPLCNMTVGNCGGKINIENREKGGCEVTVSVPIK